jgi:hypothetical protein
LLTFASPAETPPGAPSAHPRRRYGAFVHVVGVDADGAMIGVVVDVAMALDSV